MKSNYAFCIAGRRHGFALLWWAQTAVLLVLTSIGSANEPVGVDPERFHTTGAPFPGDGGYFIEFPEDPPSAVERFVEVFPTALTWPNEPLGNFLAKILRQDRYELHTELHTEPLGIQFVPDRPPLIIEWNELFLGPGPLAEGIRTPTGAIWRPAFWVWGEFRTAIQYFDNGVGDPAAEFANRLDLFGQINLSGTERIVYGVRPFDKENAAGTGRRFLGADFRDGGLPGGNGDTQTLFFEGDVGEIFRGWIRMISSCSTMDFRSAACRCWRSRAC